MSFLTPALLAGSLLIALPIVLHLVMRREPTPLVFPALRFVQKRKSTNQTRMNLRHWLLLALRCAAIGLLAFALARPTLLGSGLQGGQTGVVSAVLVFDNSPRMQYRVAGETRLDASKELAGWLLEQLPGDSRVGVLTQGSPRGKRLADRDAAKLRVERVGVSHRERPLEAAVRDAADLLAEREGDRREVYLFTDLAAAAWSTATREAIAEQLDRVDGATLFLVDVGAERAANAGLATLKLPGGTLTAGQALAVEAELANTNAAPASAEIWIESPGAAPVKRGEALLEPGAASVAFSVASLDLGVHQGYVTLPGADALAADNTRYFTVRVEPPRSVLLAGRSATATLFVDQALAPLDAAGGEPAVYETERVDTAELRTKPLAGYQSVWLLDPPPLETAVWRRLDDYARAGGSVVVALGRAARGEAFNQSAPQGLLAGRLKWVSRDASYLRPPRYDHPAIAELADFAEAIVWQDFPVFRYWLLDPLAGDAVVVAPLANGDPAITERPVGRGRVLTFATPLSDPSSNDPWNLLPTGPDPWPFLAMTRGVADYVGGAGSRQWNYAAGEPAVVPAPSGATLSSYVLRLPSGESIKGATPAGAEIVVGATDLPGNYRLRSGGAAGRLDTGFSVNASPAVGRLDRVAFADLQPTLGESRVQLARGRTQLARQVDVGRKGRELYPWLIALVALALGAEHLVSNRFYEATVG